jgi:hypothetical protein
MKSDELSVLVLHHAVRFGGEGVESGYPLWPTARPRICPCLSVFLVAPRLQPPGGTINNGKQVL